MKTKIVYVVVASSDSVFFEQTLVSIWSAKYHNPDIPITVVIDKDTKDRQDSGYYSYFLSMVDEEIVKDFLPEMSNMERSRWLKLSLREIVSGDFLYLDADTVIVGKLDGLDSLQCNVGFVYDFNTPLRNNPSVLYYDLTLKNMFDQKLDHQGYYFNGGAYYVKDTDIAHNFMQAWFNNWRYCVKHGYLRDQLSLVKTSQDNADDVEEIDGIYNCQLSVNIQYFNDARILHFYKNSSTMHPFSPFFDKKFYQKIKEEQTLSDKVKMCIINCKNEIEGPTFICCKNDITLVQSRTFEALQHAYIHNKFIYKLILYFSKVYLRLHGEKRILW